MKRPNTALLEELSNIVTSIYAADGKDQLLQALQAGFRSWGFEAFKLGCHKRTRHDLVLNPTLSSWPDKLPQKHEQEEPARNDPMMGPATETGGPFTWSTRNSHADAGEEGDAGALYAGLLQSGVVIPLAGRPGRISSISVGSHSEIHFDDAIVHAITIVANAAAMKSEMLELCPDISDELDSLSEQQVEILKWAAEGKSNIDIAEIMSLSRRGVTYHMSEILRKLGVVTRSQAIAIYAGNPR